MACNSSLPLSPTFYRTGGRISRTFPLKALETEDKSRLLIPAHVKNLKKKTKISSFRDVACLYNTLISFIPFYFTIRINIYSKIFRVVYSLFQDNHLFPRSSFIFVHTLLSLVEVTEYERISRLNARHLYRLNYGDFFPF